MRAPPAASESSAPAVAAGYDRRFTPAPLGDPTSAVIDRRYNNPAGLVARFFLLLIRLYQRTLSPALPVLTLGGCACRFSPTCSHYAAGAIRAHGAGRGLWLALRRLLKCTPLHPGGFDPVPPAPARRRRHCTRQSAAASLPPSPTPV